VVTIFSPKISLLIAIFAAVVKYRTMKLAIVVALISSVAAFTAPLNTAVSGILNVEFSRFRTIHPFLTATIESYFDASRFVCVAVQELHGSQYGWTFQACFEVCSLHSSK
jgi:pyruvate/2-oxoacid:ferredoxin oxidoreductase alpha subunit